MKASCSEALYVRRLALRAGSSVTLDTCGVYYGQLVDEGGTISTLGCGELRFVPTGDSDADGDLDQVDYDALVPCFCGPTGGPIGSPCAPFDFD